MAKNAHRSIVLYFFAILWLLIALTPAYGRGRQDPDLSRADQLINEKEYDQAILVLSDFTRRNPDKFELAQQRLQRIYQIRETFNRIADELIEVIVNDPDDSEKIVELTAQLRTLENENSPLMINFILRIQELAQFNIYRNQLRNILERGRGLLDAGDYLGAIQTYSTGMDIMRTEFFAAGFGREIESTVTSERANLNTIIASFEQNSTPMRVITEELAQAINMGQIARINDLLTQMTVSMDRLIDQKKNLYASVNTLDRILEDIRNARPETGDRNHLSFISRLVHGRSGETVQEGMLGAFDVLWKNSVGTCINSIALFIELQNSSAITSLIMSDYTAVINTLGGTENYLHLSSLFFDKQRQLFEGGLPQTIHLYENLILYDDLQPYLRIKSISEANTLLLQAARINARQRTDRTSTVSWQEQTLDLGEAMIREQETRSVIAGMQRELDLVKNNAM